MAILVLPMGISGSGKSTWSLSMVSKGYDIVKTDGLRKELTGTIAFNPEKNNEIVEEAEKRVLDLLRSGRNVILDATNLKTSQRRPLIEKVREFFPETVIKYKLMVSDIDTSHERIQEDLRNGLERSAVPKEVLEMQLAEFLRTLEDIKEEQIEPFEE